jgi:exosome complex component CSL4
MTEQQSLRYDMGAVVAPGDRLGAARGWAPGPGTYLRQGHVYAATAGRLQLHSSSDEHSKLLSVVPRRQELASRQVLTVGQVVLCRVVRIALQQAAVEIVAVEGLGQLSYPHEAVIRREDVRTATPSSGSMELKDSFRPGDLVVARILSLGDTRRYFLATAEPQLGVIHAVSAKSGNVMAAISWKEMQCPETGVKEARKCAKPRSLRQSEETL